jgi:hypothetical protein
LSKNHDVDHVRFKWIPPSGSPITKDIVPTAKCPAGDSPYKKCASDTETLTTPGDWTLKIAFCDSNVQKDVCHNILKRIHVSILVTPEFPASSGTIAAAIAPAGILFGYLKFGRKTKAP